MSTSTNAIPVRGSRWYRRLRPRAVTLRGVLRSTGVVFAVLMAVVALLIAISAVMRIQTVTLPALTGDAPVGRTELALRDSGRPDLFATDGRARELAVWVWYPAAEGSAGAPAPYLPSAWAPRVNNLGPLSQDLTAVRTNSLADAPLEGRPPVIVPLPGLGQPVASYSALAEDLASHGYAVVGINPTESADVVFPDGHLVPATALGGVAEPSIDAWYAKAAQVTNVSVDDAEFVVRTLAASPPQIGALDFDQVAYVGHSVGGAAAFEACRQDPECAAAIDLDGTLWTDVRTAGLEAPSLLVQKEAPAECDGFCQRAETDFAHVVAAGTQRLAVTGSTHMSFSDVGLMWNPIMRSTLGSIDPSRMMRITRDTVRSFLDMNVRGMPASTLSALTARYPELR